MSKLSPIRNSNVPDTRALPSLESRQIRPTGDRSRDPVRQELPALASLQLLPEHKIATGYIVAEHVEPAHFQPRAPRPHELPYLASTGLMPERVANQRRLRVLNASVWRRRQYYQHACLNDRAMLYRLDPPVARQFGSSAFQQLEGEAPTLSRDRYYQHASPYDRTILHGLDNGTNPRSQQQPQSPSSGGTLSAGQPQSSTSTSTGIVAAQSRSSTSMGTIIQRPPPILVLSARFDSPQYPSSLGTLNTPFSPKAPCAPGRPATDPPNSVGTFEVHKSSHPARPRRASVPGWASNMSIAQLKRRFIPPGHRFNPVRGQMVRRQLADDLPNIDEIRRDRWEEKEMVERIAKLLENNPFYRWNDENLEWDELYDAMLRRFAANRRQ